MAEFEINGINVKFPFEPYDLQKDYMRKVIECLQKQQNGVLESPTGTGKTLSLLCSSLAWLEMQKLQFKSYRIQEGQQDINLEQMESLNRLEAPKIIYSSRTHTQLQQAMKELKHTSYKNIRATVIASREQLCIHPEVQKENNSTMKNQLCQIKVQAHACFYHTQFEKAKRQPYFIEQPVIDVEDLVSLGNKHKFCPYYMAKELKQYADIIFMPYNYLVDAKTRKALGIELQGNVVILDEAHNIEKMCEDSASLQLKSTDVALAIEELTEIMKIITSDETLELQDFKPDDVATMKEILLAFEKAFDEVEIKNEKEGDSFEANFLFTLFAKAGIGEFNWGQVVNLTQKFVQFLAAINNGPFQRKGVGLQIIEDVLFIMFSNSKSDGFKNKVNRCYRVHITVEQPDNSRGRMSTWLSKQTAKSGCRVLNYWCFSPGFGMSMLMSQNVRCIILTSGTLAPLKPLITELELKVDVQLENPHIVKSDQFCVKILGKAPNGYPLNCNYENRSKPEFIKALGMTINNLVRFIPEGVLIFFPSYPIMEKCKDQWQESGIWTSIAQQKSINVEPKTKLAFTESMNNYYAALNDPSSNGAIFMGVCRGKVSEGLDFANGNGRAVLIIGLPYPPMKDPRVIHKKRYMDVCRSMNKEYIGGDDWYGLEATKAVNQAIGRVIRHKGDYGAIILLDTRFNSARVINQMSRWLRSHIKPVNTFGEFIRDLRLFFNTAKEKYPLVHERMILPPDTSQTSSESAFDSTGQSSGGASKGTTSSYFNMASCSSTSVLNARNSNDVSRGIKRQRVDYSKLSKMKMLKSIEKPSTEEPKPLTKDDIKEYLAMVKKTLVAKDYNALLELMKGYKENNDFTQLQSALDDIFIENSQSRFIILGLQPFIKKEHRELFDRYWEKMR